MSGLRPTPLLFPSGLPVHSLWPGSTCVAPDLVRFPVRVRTAHQKPAGSGARGCSQALPPHGDQALGTLGADNGGGTGSTGPSLQGRDCLPASRSRRERCSSFLPQGRRAPRPLQSGSGFHDLSRGGLSTPAPAGLPDFHPPSLTFRANLFTQPLPALAGGTQSPLTGLWGIQLPPERKTSQRRFFARLRRGPVNPEFSGDFPPPSCLLDGRGNGAVPASRALFQRAFYDFQRRVYTDKTLSGARPYRFAPTL